MLITSVQNPKIKYVIKLRESRERKKESVMLVEGRAELELALANGVKPRTIFYCPELVKPEFIDQIVNMLNVECYEVPANIFAKIAYRENPDGVLAICPALEAKLENIKLSANPFVVIIEAVEKPGNLGAILRTCDAAKVEAVIICDPKIDLGNPNVVRSSRGTLFTVPLAVTDTATAQRWLKAHGLQTVAATPEATTVFTDVNLRQPCAIIVGSESAGLSPAWRATTDMQARIPMLGKINSLNVSVSLALFVYEAIRQRKL